jgi:catalase
MQRVQQVIMGSAGDKISDLQRDTRVDEDGSRLTSDFGVRQANTDDWLKVVSEDHTGPMLLEDMFGREKVSFREHGEWRAHVDKHRKDSPI